MLSETDIEEIYNRVIECNSIYHNIDKDTIISLLLKSSNYNSNVYPSIDIETISKDIIVDAGNGKRYLVKNRSDGGRFWYCIQPKV